MDKKELRLGNIISFDGMEHIVNETTFMIHESKLEPIPLTEQWLVKLGFEKIDDYSIHYKKDIFNWYSNGIVIEFDNGITGYNHYSDCKNIHQIQNLYFAIYEEELTINF